MLLLGLVAGTTTASSTELYVHGSKEAQDWSRAAQEIANNISSPEDPARHGLATIAAPLDYTTTKQQQNSVINKRTQGTSQNDELYTVATSLYG